MNPHFIFNCLHVVQQYILENDIIKANKYLSSFARLIRKTLDNSLQTMIPIADELAYLTNYLNLEQLRVEGMFDYTFDIDSELDINNTCIPSMMLQPYIENAIRHGIEYKKEKKGMIRIAFKKIGQHVICLVEDNGIGRTAAQALKNNEYNTHQSRGMQLTAERLQLLSRELNAPIAVNITDVMEIPGLVAGTRVTIHLPIIIT